MVGGWVLPPMYPAGACPAGRRLTLPLWCPQGACLLYRRLTLPFRNPLGGLALFVACQPCS